MVTNDDGIDAPGLQALVRVLVSANLFNVQVCTPDSYVFSLRILSVTFESTGIVDSDFELLMITDQCMVL